jgi:hypothetical protein
MYHGVTAMTVHDMNTEMKQTRHQMETTLKRELVSLWPLISCDVSSLVCVERRVWIPTTKRKRS